MVDRHSVNKLRMSLKGSRAAFWGIFFFSALVNIMMLNGSIYMLQLYDRVMTSHSVPTLVVITLIAILIYAFQGVLDVVRSKISSRVGRQLEADSQSSVFRMWVHLGISGRKRDEVQFPLQDMSTVKGFFENGGPATLFDLPWVPFYIGILYLFHPWMGYFGFGCALLSIGLSVYSQMRTRQLLLSEHKLNSRAMVFAQQCNRNAESIIAMGMVNSVGYRDNEFRKSALKVSIETTERGINYQQWSRIIRQVMQSGSLGLAGYLAILGEVSAGSIIAGSILLGRALAPLDQLIARTKLILSARQSYQRLVKLLSDIDLDQDTVLLPDPKGFLDVQIVAAGAPEQAENILQSINFRLSPGDALGVIGPSAAGKSTLARLLIGVWKPKRGHVRLDGATFDQWSPEEIGRHVGYLPQGVELLEGTIKDNICRFDPNASDEDLVEASRRAGVHDMILQLPNGYNTYIGENGSFLSFGQRQRIALARALYGDPALVVLDEPNSNLDAQGDHYLSAAIADMRKRGKTVVIMAHRPSAIAAVNLLLMIENGGQRAFGPKEEVLKQVTRVAETAPSSKVGEIGK